MTQTDTTEDLQDVMAALETDAPDLAEKPRKKKSHKKKAPEARTKIAEAVTAEQTAQVVMGLAMTIDTLNRLMNLPVSQAATPALAQSFAAAIEVTFPSPDPVVLAWGMCAVTVLAVYGPAIAAKRQGIDYAKANEPKA